MVIDAVINLRFSAKFSDDFSLQLQQQCQHILFAYCGDFGALKFLYSTLD